MMDRERIAVIAMKGHPGSGKSTLATAIAKSLKCPLVDKDHFRDSTHAVQQALLAQAQTPRAAAAKLLNDLSYEAMWRVASTQLGLGLRVVVDSPLSRRAHLDRLLDMSGGRVMVVDCRPGDEAKWRRRLESRGRTEWHKPSTWREMEELLEAYGGCWDYDMADVPHLVFDTTVPVQIADLASRVVELVNSDQCFVKTNSLQ